MTKERCIHADNQIVDLVDRWQNWRGYQCPYCEIERLREEVRSWIEANATGGWIDKLRQRAGYDPIYAKRASDEPNDAPQTISAPGGPFELRLMGKQIEPPACPKCGGSGRMWDGNGGDMTECDCRHALKSSAIHTNVDSEQR